MKKKQALNTGIPENNIYIVYTYIYIFLYRSKPLLKMMYVN